MPRSGRASPRAAGRVAEASRNGAGEPRARSTGWHQRRAEVIDISAAVFARRGYHGTGTTELCEANQLAKGALYYYIGSKEELLAAINDRIMDEMMLGAARVRRAGGRPSEQLFMLGQEYLDVHVRFPDHLSVLMHDYKALTGELAERFVARRREYEAEVEAIIGAGIKAGEFRDVDVHSAMHAWIGLMTYMGKADRSPSAARYAATFEDIFMRGLFA